MHVYMSFAIVVDDTLFCRILTRFSSNMLKPLFSPPFTSYCSLGFSLKFVPPNLRAYQFQFWVHHIGAHKVDIHMYTCMFIVKAPTFPSVFKSLSAYTLAFICSWKVFFPKTHARAHMAMHRWTHTNAHIHINRNIFACSYVHSLGFRYVYLVSCYSERCTHIHVLVRCMCIWYPMILNVYLYAFLVSV